MKTTELKIAKFENKCPHCGGKGLIDYRNGNSPKSSMINIYKAKCWNCEREFSYWEAKVRGSA